MKVTILQTDIVWEDKQKNLDHLYERLKELHGKSDLAVLPEMFSTGFTMKSELLAEPVSGKTITTLRTWAAEFQIALTGSYIASDNGSYYNRVFFITPDGNNYFYDKKHLFRMGNEKEHFSPGEHKIIIPYNGWKISLLVCYDIRFPVWSRNLDNAYDLLIYVANWPATRRRAWDILLAARAIENMSYVCGVNRVGRDGNALEYNGGSALYSAKGEMLACIPDHTDGSNTVEISLSELNAFREKFPVWKDADRFILSFPPDSSV